MTNEHEILANRINNCFAFFRHNLDPKNEKKFTLTKEHIKHAKEVLRLYADHKCKIFEFQYQVKIVYIIHCLEAYKLMTFDQFINK